jgi:hypothetical protein
MSDKDKKKLCWNCEGSVLRHLETCPYCGVYLSPTEQDLSHHPLIPPPYPLANENGSPEVVEGVAAQAVLEKEEKSLLTPLLTLISGSSLLLFGLSLWLFSERGRLTLSWSDDLAPVFLLVALPLLFFGGRNLNRLDD